MKSKTSIEKYRNKILARSNYSTAKPYDYVKDFIDEENLLYILYEVNCTEATLTSEGLDFLKEYYGLEYVAELIKKDIEEGVDFSWKLKDDIINWLNNRGRISLSAFLAEYNQLKDEEKSARLKFAICNDYTIEEVAKFLNLPQEEIGRYWSEKDGEDGDVYVR